MALTSTISAQQSVAVAASLDTQSILYTAVEPGSKGNNINVTHVNPGQPNQSLRVLVSDNSQSIFFYLATNALSAVTTTASELLAAVQKSVDATRLVTVALSGSGATVQAASTQLYFSSGANQGQQPNGATTFVLVITNSGAATTLSGIKPRAVRTGQTVPLSTKDSSLQDQSIFADNVIPASGTLTIRFQGTFYEPGSYDVECSAQSPGVANFSAASPVTVQVSKVY